MSPEKKILKIDNKRCKGCALCIEACPRGALTLSEGLNAKGYRYIELTYPEKCNGCGLCVMMCPDCGIEVIEDGA